MSHEETNPRKDVRALMRAHVDALFTYDAAGRMLRVNDPEGKVAPRLYVGRTVHGVELRCRYDVDDELAQALAAVALSEPGEDALCVSPYGAARYEELLARHAPIERTSAGPAYCFPRELPVSSDVVLATPENANLLAPPLDPWLADIALGRPTVMLVNDGQAVSICSSVRITDVAHEAGVETAAEFRGRGYAARVVAAWARMIRERGRMPLYSTSWQNQASQAVARKLGLLRYGSTPQIT